MPAHYYVTLFMRHPSFPIGFLPTLVGLLGIVFAPGLAKLGFLVSLLIGLVIWIPTYLVANRRISAIRYGDILWGTVKSVYNARKPFSVLNYSSATLQYPRNADGLGTFDVYWHFTGPKVPDVGDSILLFCSEGEREQLDKLFSPILFDQYTYEKWVERYAPEGPPTTQQPPSPAP